MSEDSSFYVVHPHERQGFPCFTVVSLFKVRKTHTGQSYSTPGDIQCLSVVLWLVYWQMKTALGLHS